MWWWNFGVPAVIGGAYLWKLFSTRLQRLRYWREALAPYQVEDVESSSLLSWPRVTFRSGPLTVRITSATGSEDKVKVVIEGAEGFSILKLRRQLWKREIELGDEAFDDKFIVEGPVRPVAAWLDATLRGQLVRAYADCNPLEIEDGRLRAELREEELSRVLSVLLKIGCKLAESMAPGDVDRQIAENARRDSEAGVRLFNLLLLVREHPGDPSTLDVLRAACSDESPKVQVRAAIELGDEGRKGLLKLAERAKDDDATAQAVSHLGSDLPLGSARRILLRSLNKEFHQTAHACLKVLGQRRGAAVDTLVQILTEEKGELAVAAAKALGETGAIAAEAPLLQALQSEDSDLREAAAAALGRVGSVEAVQPLKDATERYWLDLGLRRASQQAIAEIQSRLEGASPGQLSLAETEAGQLSLAQAEAGQLSLTQAELPMLPHTADEAEQQPPSRTRETPAGRRA